MSVFGIITITYYRTLIYFKSMYTIVYILFE